MIQFLLLVLLAFCGCTGLDLSYKSNWAPSYADLSLARARFALARTDGEFVDVREVVNDAAQTTADTGRAGAAGYPQVPNHSVGPGPAVQAGPAVQPPPPPQAAVEDPPIQGTFEEDRRVPQYAPEEAIKIESLHAPSGLEFWAEIDTADWCGFCKSWITQTAPSLAPVYTTGKQMDGTAHIRIVDHGSSEPDFRLPRFTFWYRLRDGQVAQIGEPVIGAIAKDAFKTEWKSRVAMVDELNKNRWKVAPPAAMSGPPPTAEPPPEDARVWEAVAVSLAKANNKPVPRAGNPVPMNKKDFVGTMLSLLGGQTIQLSDGITATSNAEVRISVRRQGDTLSVSFLDPKPKVTVKKFINITTSIDGFTVTSREARVHLANVPKMLEPTFPLVGN
jgi:hypothetical protein